MPEIGPITQMQLQDPIFADVLWKMTPASMAVRLSEGRYKTWPYIQLLSRKLVDVAMGKCKRLIVVMPPRHGKSHMVSWWFCVWYMEQFQRNRIILASYEADFASKWGAKVRDTMGEFQDKLTMRFKTKNPAQHFWETTQGGAMMCAGVGGPITGKGANVFIIDDFVKNSEEANSLTMREKIWDWWTSTARTRLEPNGSVIVMATRWHSDDLIGRLIDPQFGNEKGVKEDWEVFCFPAAAEPESELHYAQFGVKVNNLNVKAVSGLSIVDRLAEGDRPEWTDMLGRKRGEPLCPERYDERDLALLRGGSLRDWYAMFQQRPGDEADDGNVYGRFDDRKNCRILHRDHRMQLFVSMDFNVDPMCVAIGQYDKGMGSRMMERCEILEEIILPNSNTFEMMVRLIKELEKYKNGYVMYVEFYGDAAGTQRSAQSQKTNWQIVAEHLSMHTWLHYKFIRKSKNPTIVDRVNAFNTMLESADGTVRLYINDVKCPALIRDMKKVKWDQDSAGNKTGQLDKSDKKLTHISDAAGYAIEYNFGLKARSGGRKGIMQ